MLVFHNIYIYIYITRLKNAKQEINVHLLTGFTRCKCITSKRIKKSHNTNKRKEEGNFQLSNFCIIICSRKTIQNSNPIYLLIMMKCIFKLINKMLLFRLSPMT